MWKKRIRVGQEAEEIGRRTQTTKVDKMQTSSAVVSLFGRNCTSDRFGMDILGIFNCKIIIIKISRCRREPDPSPKRERRNWHVKQHTNSEHTRTSRKTPTELHQKE